MQGADLDSRPLVAHLIYRLAIGGLENGLVNLLNWMPADRYRHVIICLTESTDFSTRLHRDDIEIIELKKNPGKDLMVHWRLWKLLRRLQPTIFHTRNLATMEYTLTAALAGVPVRIHGEHGWDAEDPNGERLRYVMLRKICLPLVAQCVAVSRHIQQWLVAKLGVPASRVVQIYNGVDTEKFRGHANSETVKEQAFVLGFVARLDAIKDPMLLLKALVLLRQRDHSCRLIVVGDGPMAQAMSDFINASGLHDIVVMAGARDDVDELLRQMDIFVLPSLNEGISNTILEAMSTGLPVVASRVGGNPELVVEGSTGYLFTAGDVDELVSCIEEYLSEPQRIKQHGAAARQRVEAQFSPSAMVSGYMGLYDKLIAMEN